MTIADRSSRNAHQTSPRNGMFQPRAVTATALSRWSGRSLAPLISEEPITRRSGGVGGGHRRGHEVEHRLARQPVEYLRGVRHVAEHDGAVAVVGPGAVGREESAGGGMP